MFGIGMPELILILAVALIVIGPKKLPDLAKSMGRALGEFKRATQDFKETIEIDQDVGDLKKAFQDINQDIDPKPFMKDAPEPAAPEPDAAEQNEPQRPEADADDIKGPDHDS